jgi:hypothetical protein
MSMDKDTLERLEQMYQFTASNLAELFAKADDQSLSDEEREEAEREALDCVYGSSTRKVVRLILAGGGPSAWLDVESDSPLWRLAEYHVQGWEE